MQMVVLQQQLEPLRIYLVQVHRISTGSGKLDDSANLSYSTGS